MITFETALRFLLPKVYSFGPLALLGGAAVLGGLGYLGSKKAASSAETGARDAAASSLASTEKNIEFQKWLWGEQKALEQPYADAGVRAVGAYEREMQQGFTLDDFYADPGYQYGLNEGTKARENAASSRGMQLSGPQQKAMQRYGTDYASTKYNEAFNRRQTQLDNLYRMIASGQGAASGQAAAGQQMGTQVGGSIAAGGRAQSQMYSDIGNINASQAMAPYNTLMDVGGMYMMGKAGGVF